jgi:outer membrane protein assembly factor BamB
VHGTIGFVVRPVVVVLVGALLAGCTTAGPGQGGAVPASPPAETASTLPPAPPTTTGSLPPSGAPVTLPVPGTTAAPAITTAPPLPAGALVAVPPGGPARWALPAGDGVEAAFSPVAVGGTVAAQWSDCAGTGGLLGVDAATGALRWRTPLEDAPAAATDELSGLAGTVVVLVRGEPSVLVAVDAASGAERWRAPLGSDRVTAADLRADPVVVAEQAGIGSPTRVRAFGRTDGTLRWDRQAVGERGVLALVVAPEAVAALVLTPADPPSVAGLDPASGTLVWEAPGFGLPAAASAAAGLTTATRPDAGLVGLDLATGTPRWERPDLVDPFVPPGTPLAAAGHLLAGDLSTGRVHALRLADGTTVWLAGEVEAPAGAGPGGFALVGSGAADSLAARVVALDGQELGLVGPLPTSGGRELVPLLVGADGTTYVGRGCPT